MVLQDVESTWSLLRLLKGPWRSFKSVLTGVRCALHDRKNLSASVRLLFAHVVRADLMSDTQRLTVILEVLSSSVFEVAFKYGQGRLRFGPRELSGDIEIRPEQCKRFDLTAIVITAWISPQEADAIKTVVSNENHLLLGMSSLEIQITATNVTSPAILTMPDLLQFNTDTLRANPEWIAGQLPPTKN